MLTAKELIQQEHVVLVEHWGRDQRIIEDNCLDGNFFGWNDRCPTCHALLDDNSDCGVHGLIKKPIKGGRRLLLRLYERRRTAAFNVVGFAVKVKLPVLVAVEWLRQQPRHYPLMTTTQHVGVADTVVMVVRAGLGTWIQFIQWYCVDSEQPVMSQYAEAIKHIIKQVFPETHALAYEPVETSSIYLNTFDHD